MATFEKTKANQPDYPKIKLKSITEPFFIQTASKLQLDGQGHGLQLNLRTQDEHGHGHGQKKIVHAN